MIVTNKIQQLNPKHTEQQEKKILFLDFFIYFFVLSTPIYVAAQNGHYEVVKTLIEHGANVEAKYKGYYTPLYIAAQKGHLGILQLLLVHRADLEQKWYHRVVFVNVLLLLLLLL